MVSNKIDSEQETSDLNQLEFHWAKQLASFCTKADKPIVKAFRLAHLVLTQLKMVGSQKFVNRPVWGRGSTCGLFFVALSVTWTKLPLGQTLNHATLDACRLSPDRTLNHATCTVHFHYAELCSVCCADKFGLEFNWNGALNPVLRFCRRTAAAGMLSMIFFRFEQESLQNRGNSKNQITRLKGFGTYCKLYQNLG